MFWGETCLFLLLRKSLVFPRDSSHCSHRKEEVCQVGYSFSIPNPFHNPTKMLGLMLLHPKHSFYCYFSHLSFAGFSATAENKFSSNSKRNQCERTGSRMGRVVGARKLWIKERGVDGEADRFGWSLRA